MPEKSEDPDSNKNPSKRSSNLWSWMKSIFSHNLLPKSIPVDNFIEKLQKRRIASREQYILNNFFYFADKTVNDIIIPRSDISAICTHSTLEELNDAINKGHHTRTLVYNEGLDNIIGFIHIKDVFRTVTQKKDFVLQDLMHKPLYVSSSIKLIDMLAMMQKQRIHIAVIVDEYGGTDGMVTIEDIIEELLGPIEDEHDNIESYYKVLDSRTLLVSARAKIEDIEQIIGVPLKSEEDECDTIGGLVLARSGAMVVIGAKVTIAENIQIEVVDANSRTLKQVKLTFHSEHKKTA